MATFYPINMSLSCSIFHTEENHSSLPFHFSSMFLGSNFCPCSFIQHQHVEKFLLYRGIPQIRSLEQCSYTPQENIVHDLQHCFQQSKGLSMAEDMNVDTTTLMQTPSVLNATFSKPLPDVSKIKVFNGQNFQHRQERFNMLLDMYGVGFSLTTKKPFSVDVFSMKANQSGFST